MLNTTAVSDPVEDLLHRIGQELQLTETQHEEAKKRYLAIGEWLAVPDSVLARLKPRIFPQGSLRIGTAVKPLARQEFDVDLVCRFDLVDPDHLENPVELLDAVEYRLRQHRDYAGMITRKNRCIEVTYANDFHLDILPACPDPSSPPDCVLVPDRDAKWWKASNPEGYARWFEGRLEILKRILEASVEPLPEQEPHHRMEPLKRAVQLVKRWRDWTYQETPKLGPISIVLTTLAGMTSGGERSVKDTLTNVIDRVNAAIPTTGRLIVLNPTNQKEDLSERWAEHPERYAAFVSGMRDLQQRWKRVVTNKGGLPDICDDLGFMFGDELVRAVVRKQAQALKESASSGRLGVIAGGPVALGDALQRGVRPIPRQQFFGD